MQRKDLGAVGVGGGLVAGAAVVAYAIGGLSYKADQAERWRARALAPRPTATTPAPPSTQPAAAAKTNSSSPSPGTGPPGFRAQPVQARSAAPSDHPSAPERPVTPRPTASDRPTPTPSPSRTCSPGALLAVQLPVTLLPCTAVQIGGS